MKHDGKIEISWTADNGEINTMAKGCDADIVDVFAKSTTAILKNVSLCGLRGKDLLNVYIAYLIDLHTKDHPIETTCVKIALKDLLGGVQ